MKLHGLYQRIPFSDFYPTIFYGKKHEAIIITGQPFVGKTTMTGKQILYIPLEFLKGVK